MTIPYTFSAINDFLRGFLERNRNNVITSRQLLTSGQIPHENWRALCSATARRAAIAHRASVLSSTACGWLIAQSLTMETQTNPRTTPSQPVLPSGYAPVESVPHDELVCVVWGTFPCSAYGVAKYAYGKWWDYTSSNPHARGRECAAPAGWIKKA